MTMTLAQVAELVGGRLEGDGELLIKGLCGVDDGAPGQLAFAFEATALAAVEAGAAAAVVRPETLDGSLPAVAVSDVRDAQIKLLRAFDPPPPPPAGIHPRALVDPSVVLGADPTIGPGAVIEAGVVIGDRCRIGANSYVGAGVRIGNDCTLHPNVTLYHDITLGHRVTIDSGAVIGAEGYSYRPEGGRHVRVPQLGTVELQDDVDVGANTCIDRAAVGKTLIGRGCKIDNLVTVAHNCRLGQHCIVVSQVGIAGSVTMGDWVILAGQSGIADHVTIGDAVVVGAQAGITHSLPPHTRWLGSPAMADREAARIFGSWRRLPDAMRQLRELQRQVEAITGAQAQ
jgi:UDP-3-O-[3-hydroxymyristoyl] glucosamine N-acyltransferase